MTHRAVRSDSYGGQGVTLNPTAGAPTSTVIWLHGLGDTAEGWVGALPINRFPRTRFIHPTAPTRPITLNGGFPMPGWFDIASLEADGKEDKPGFEESRRRLNAIIDGEIAAGVPPRKIVVGGFSQGGAVTLHTVLRSQHALAGGVVLSGWLALRSEYPGAMTEAGKAIPFFHGHGDADSIVNFKWGKGSADAIKAMGINYDFKVYSGLEHGALPEEIEHVTEFLDRVLK